jgi:hypothetical protein
MLPDPVVNRASTVEMRQRQSVAASGDGLLYGEESFGALDGEVDRPAAEAFIMRVEEGDCGTWCRPCFPRELRGAALPLRLFGRQLDGGELLAELISHPVDP